jgi:hypothetical protein
VTVTNETFIQLQKTRTRGDTGGVQTGVKEM